MSEVNTDAQPPAEPKLKLRFMQVPEAKKDARLRVSYAVRAMDYAMRNSLDPYKLKDCQDIPYLVTRIEGDTGEKFAEDDILYCFADFSKLMWCKAMGKYAVYYPHWIKTVYVPKNLPMYEDDFREIDAQKEVAFRKKVNEAFENPTAGPNRSFYPGSTAQQTPSTVAEVLAAGSSDGEDLDNEYARAISEGMGCG